MFFFFFFCLISDGQFFLDFLLKRRQRLAFMHIWLRTLKNTWNYFKNGSIVRVYWNQLKTGRSIVRQKTTTGMIPEVFILKTWCIATRKVCTTQKRWLSWNWINSLLAHCLARIILFCFHINKYKNCEIKEIHEMLKKSEFKKINKLMIGDAHFSMCFESNEPKIKFSVKNLDKLTKLEVQVMLIKKMCSTGFDLGLFNKGSGCHICLYLSKFNQSYIHLNAADYFLLHPEPMDFLNKFQAHHMYNIKTWLTIL